MADISSDVSKAPAPKGFTPGEQLYGIETQPQVSNQPVPNVQPPCEISPKFDNETNVPPNSLRARLLTVPNLVEIPCDAPEFVFCGSMRAEVEPNHDVVVLLLAADLPAEGGGFSVNQHGLKTQNGPISPAAQERLDAVLDAGARLQGDVGSAGSWVRKLISFLSGSTTQLLAPRPRIEVARSVGGDNVGFYEGDVLIQFVVTIAVVTNGPVGFHLPARFPYLQSKGLDAYLLPDTTDFVEFCAYLAHKNRVGWRGARLRASRDFPAEQRKVLATAFTRGGIVTAAYAFGAMLLGALAPAILPFLAYGSWAALGFGVATSAAAWQKARKAVRRLHLELVEHTSWRLINFAKDQTEVNAKARELGGADAKQFLAELNPREVLEGSINLLKAGVFDDNRDAAAVLNITAREAAVLCPAPASGPPHKPLAKKGFAIDPAFDEDFD